VSHTNGMEVIVRSANSNQATSFRDTFIMALRRAMLFRSNGENPGQPPAMLATGAPILNLRDVVHGGLRDRPGNLILFTVHTVDKGSHYTIG